jgi:hypothetical protein
MKMLMKSMVYHGEAWSASDVRSVGFKMEGKVHSHSWGTNELYSLNRFFLWSRSWFHQETNSYCLGL